MQMFKMNNVFLPFRRIRKTCSRGISSFFRYRFVYQRHCCHRDFVNYSDVVNNANSPGNNTIFTYRRATGNCTATAYNCVLSNPYVMRNLNLVVNFHSMSNDGIFKRPPVYCTSSSYFDIISN